MTDWMKLRSTNADNADKLQKILKQKGVQHVIVMSSLDTIIEVSGNHNNGKGGWIGKIAGDNNARITDFKYPPLRDDQYVDVSCGRTVLDKNMLDHLNRCDDCISIVAPEDVRASKGREINTERDRAKAFNDRQPVNITQPAIPLEEQQVAEPAMEVMSIEKTEESAETYFEIFERLSRIETELYVELDRVETLKKSFQEMNDIEKKLKELDDEMTRIEEERRRILTSGLNN